MKQNESLRITQNELEDYLWGAAVLLRGLIDAGDYKGYIFPLLFLKRISDVWQEERVLAMDIYSGDIAVASLAENHRFAIPDGAHWGDIRSTTTDVGSKILSCMRQIEAANPESLTGVFGDSDWTNRNLLSDEVLSNLIEHFSSEELSLTRLPEDELGNGYEFLIRKFADDSGHTAQEFYTNRTLVHLMTRMLKPVPGESVYDPTCGTGGMLISCADEVRRKGEDYRTLRLFGQELNYTTASIAKMNLFLHGIEDASIAHGDTLSKPMFTSDAGELRTFDVVLANPPYSIKNWNRQNFAKDPFGRNVWGVPPQGRADYVFFQHIAKSMDPVSGRAVVLFPHGVLFRLEERELRKKLLDSGLLESVIGLGPGLFYNSPMEAVLVTLRSRRPKDTEGKVLFMNAVELVARERSNAYLSESHQDTILDAYSHLLSVPGLSKLVGYSEIVDNDYSLAIPLYVSLVDDSVAPKPIDIAEVIATWSQSSSSVAEVIDNLILALEEHVNHGN